jgi:hypothetical protein
MNDVKKKIPKPNVPTCRHCKKNLDMGRDGPYASNMGLCKGCYFKHRINPIFGVI